MLLLALLGGVLTGLAAWFAWWNEEQRRLTRLIQRCLDGPADSVIIAHGRNAAAGISLSSGQAIVLWKGGAKALLYPLKSLLGAELIVDDAVAARVYRGEPRRALEGVNRQAQEVTLRLIFDNVRDPDFELALWAPGDEPRRSVASPAAAIQEARTWIARADAILRRGEPKVPAAVVSAPPPAVEDDEEEDEDDEAPF